MTSLLSATRTKTTAKVGISFVKHKDGRFLITKVTPLGLFGRCGFRPGQEMASINGAPLTSACSAAQVADLLKRVPLGADLEIVVVRSAPANTSATVDLTNAWPGCQFIFSLLQSLLRMQPSKDSSNDERLEKTLQLGTIQQLIYLVGLYGSGLLILWVAIPLNQERQHLSRVHEWTFYGLFWLTFGSWVLAKTVGPGSITATNMDKFDNYEYDGILYQPNIVCPTLLIPKLARSKYDRYSGTHVPRCDHYCTWLVSSIIAFSYCRRNTTIDDLLSFEPITLLASIHQGKHIWGRKLSFLSCLFSGPYSSVLLRRQCALVVALQGGCRPVQGSCVWRRRRSLSLD